MANAKNRVSTAGKIIGNGKEKIKTLIQEDDENFKRCLNVVAGTKEGQYVLNRLLEKCGQLKSSVIQLQDGSTDEGTIQYREGRRSIWIYDLYRFFSPKNLKLILFFDRRKICSQKQKVQEKA